MDTNQTQTQFEVVRVTNIGQVIIHLLVTPIQGKDGKRLTNGQIVDEVRKVFPKAKTTKACVAWYVTALKDETFRAKHDVTEAQFETFKTLKADKN